MGDWNAILDPKIDKIRRRTRGSGKCESSPTDFMVCHDRFCLDHPGREMWMWLDSSVSVWARSYLDRVLVRIADTDFVMCPMFHYMVHTNNRLVRAVS